MLRSIPVVLAMLIAFNGCTSTSSIHEEEDLVTFSHNKVTDYTLLVYESDNGDTRQVLRHKGVCELILIETKDGEYMLKKRGEEKQKLEPQHVPDVKSRMETLIFTNVSDTRLKDFAR